MQQSCCMMMPKIKSGLGIVLSFFRRFVTSIGHFFGLGRRLNQAAVSIVNGVRRHVLPLPFKMPLDGASAGVRRIGCIVCGGGSGHEP